MIKVFRLPTKARGYVPDNKSLGTVERKRGCSSNESQLSVQG